MAPAQAPRAPTIATPTIPADDHVVIFRTLKSRVRGRLVRLGAAADGILTPHGIPDVASAALGEAAALTALLGSALPDGSRMILQTRTDGVVSFLISDCDWQGHLRGYARYDAETLHVLRESGEKLDIGSLLGDGHLAITIEQGPDGERYQGVMALEGAPLATAAAAYFEQRESLPTYVRLAVAQHFQAANGGAAARRQWRAGGLMIQDETHGRASAGDDDERDGWLRVRILAATIEDHELLDPELTSERLLLRLFHEEGVLVERVAPMSATCRCARERVLDMLKSFGTDDLSGMRDEAGRISVSCEFCTARYVFATSEIGEPQG